MMSLLCVVDLNRSKRVCVQSATGVYLTALPAPGGIQIAGKTPGDLSSEHISSIQKRINDTIAVNKELYQINPPVRQSTLADTVNLWKLIFVIKPEKSHLSGQVCGNVGLFPTAVAEVSCMKPFSTTELKKFKFMMFMVKTYPDEYAITSLFVVILYCNKWEQFSHFFLL